MKFIFVIVYLIFPGNSILYGQNKIAGIFKTHTDFLNHHVTHAGEHTRIRPNDLYKKEFVEVKYQDTLFSYRKDAVYGYVDNEGFVYRFYSGISYSLLNPGEKIPIYRTSSGTGAKNFPITENYFFSSTDSSKIVPLTLLNVLNVFSNDTKFNEFIEIYFRRDDELIEYDYIHSIYKLNRLYELSQPKN